MKFSLVTSDLLKILKPMVMPSDKNVMSTQVKVHASTGGVMFFASDMSIAVTSYVPCDTITTVGVCTAHTKSLVSLLSKFDKTSPTTFELGLDGKLLVKNKRSRFVFSSHDPNTIRQEAVPMDGYHAVNPSSLLESIDMVMPAISNDESRPAWNSILIEPSDEEGFMRVVAVDGHKLMSFKAVGIVPKSVLLPKTCLTHLKEFLSRLDECEMYISDSTFIVRGNGHIFESRVLSADRFPKYKNFLPAALKYKIRFSVEEILKAARCCELFVDSKQEALVITLNKDTAIISAKGPLGSAEEEVQLLENNVEIEAVLAFKCKYLLSMLSKFEHTVEFGFNDIEQAFILTEKNNFFAILMPIKLGA